MNKTTILTDAEVKFVLEKAFKAFGFDTSEKMKKTGVNFEHVIRLSSLGAKCKEAREELGLSIKEASRELKVPQYRLKAIDDPRENEILPEVLTKYVEFLGIESWFEKWKEANPELAESLLVTETDAE